MLYMPGCREKWSSMVGVFVEERSHEDLHFLSMHSLLGCVLKMSQGEQRCFPLKDSAHTGRKLFDRANFQVFRAQALLDQTQLHLSLCPHPFLCPWPRVLPQRRHAVPVRSSQLLLQPLRLTTHAALQKCPVLLMRSLLLPSALAHCQVLGLSSPATPSLMLLRHSAMPQRHRFKIYV